MDFTGFKLRRTKKYSFNHITVSYITYSKLVYPYVENDVLILDYYRLDWRNGKLKKLYTIKVYKNKTWEIDGVKQTKKPKVGEVKAYTILNNESGYYLVKSFCSKIVNEFINNKHSGTLIGLIKFLTRKKAKTYIPEYLQQKCNSFRKEYYGYLYDDGDFIYRNYHHGIIITKYHQVYNFDFRSFELIVPRHIHLTIHSGVYEKLNQFYLCINNTNINDILYFLEHGLINLMRKVNDKPSMRVIRKLSFSKKQILNKYKMYYHSPFYKVDNLNSYRDEDFDILVQCFSQNFPNVLEKYKNYRKYFEYSKILDAIFAESYFYLCRDYFHMLNNHKNVISTNRFPKYPPPAQIERFHDILVEHIRNLKDQEKMQRIKALNKTYDLLKPQLKKLEYSK